LVTFLKLFEAVNGALSEQPKILNDIQKGQLKSIEINQRLQQSQADALETDGFLEFQQMFSNLWKEAQILWYDFIAGFTNGFNLLYDTIIINNAGIVGAVKGIPKAFEIVKQSLFDIFKGIGFDTAKSVLKADFNYLVKQTDLEEETIREVVKILEVEFN
jgi:hypothetical protein